MGELTCLEICAGAGGQSLGLEQAGFIHEAAVELDPDACETLRLNRGSEWKIIEDDVHNLEGRALREHRPVLRRRARAPRSPSRASDSAKMTTATCSRRRCG